MKNNKHEMWFVLSAQSEHKEKEKRKHQTMIAKKKKNLDMAYKIATTPMPFCGIII